MTACRELLGEVRSGNLADFNGFADRFERDYGQLELLQTDEMDSNSRTRFHRQLKDLDRIRVQLFNELADKRGDLVRRLTGIAKGQQGLDAYK